MSRSYSRSAATGRQRERVAARKNEKKSKKTSSNTQSIPKYIEDYKCEREVPSKELPFLILIKEIKYVWSIIYIQSAGREYIVYLRIKNLIPMHIIINTVTAIILSEASSFGRSSELSL